MPAPTAITRCAATGRKPGYPLVLVRPTLALSRLRSPVAARGIPPSAASVAECRSRIPASTASRASSMTAASFHTAATAYRQSRSSHQYLERQRHDPYVLARNSPAAASAIGIPSLDKWINIGHGPMIPGCVSRAAFKLYELNWQAGFLTRPPAEKWVHNAPTSRYALPADSHEGHAGVKPRVILDLGAAPGGWTQIAFALLHDQYRHQRDIAKAENAAKTLREGLTRAREIEGKLTDRLEKLGVPSWARQAYNERPQSFTKKGRRQNTKIPILPSEKPAMTENQKAELDKLREDPMINALWKLWAHAKAQTLKYRYALADASSAITKATNRKRRPGDTIEFEKLKVEPLREFSKGVESGDVSALLPLPKEGEQGPSTMVESWSDAVIPAPTPTAIFALDLLPLHAAVQNLVTAFGADASAEIERQSEIREESSEEEEDIAKRHVHLDFLKGDFTTTPVQAELQRRIAAWKAQFEPEGQEGTTAKGKSQPLKVHPVTGAPLPAPVDESKSLKVQVIMSDMSPNITGSATQNEGNYLRLLESLLQFTAQHLEPGEDSWLVVKVFYSPGVEEFRKVFLEGKAGGSDVAFSTEGIPKGGMFRSVKAEKVKGSRVKSREVYWVCRGFRGYNLAAQGA